MTTPTLHTLDGEPLAVSKSIAMKSFILFLRFVIFVVQCFVFVFELFTQPFRCGNFGGGTEALDELNELERRYHEEMEDGIVVVMRHLVLRGVPFQ